MPRSHGNTHMSPPRPSRSPQRTERTHPRLSLSVSFSLSLSLSFSSLSLSFSSLSLSLSLSFSSLTLSLSLVTHTCARVGRKGPRVARNTLTRAREVLGRPRSTRTALHPVRRPVVPRHAPVCVCVCVCERDRERERPLSQRPPAPSDVLALSRTLHSTPSDVPLYPAKHLHRGGLVFEAHRLLYHSA